MKLFAAGATPKTAPVEFDEQLGVKTLRVGWYTSLQRRHIFF
jgi:hypothetical protein